MALTVAPTARSAVNAMPNVTPMIDVMLVLLILFMIAVPAIDARARLPEAVMASSRPERPEDRTLTIDAAGHYSIAGRPVAGEALPAALSGLAAADTLDRVLFVKADTTLAYAVVRSAMATASASGFRVVGLVTVPGATARAP